MSSPPELWDGVVRRLGAELPAFALEAWVRPLVPETLDGAIRLACPTRFHRDRVRERYLKRIERCVAAEAGRPLRVDLVLGAPLPELPAEAGAAPPRPPTGPEPERRPRRTSVERTVRRPTQRVIPYSFDSFVVGPCNALAREASLAVARDRQRGLNPLYLCSNVGLGKTHLAQSIVEEAKRGGNGRTLYGSAEAFTNRFTSALRSRDMDGFKRRFRQGCDLLVVEDVQFLGSKNATQLELFHTVAHLMDAGARVVLTGDRLPRDIPNLDPRLRSQMTGGLVAEIEAPDLQLRREILSSKAARGGVGIPPECLELLASSVQGSVRDLEGALIQLVTSASLMDRPLDLALTRAALRKLQPLRTEPRRLRPEDVVGVVAAFFRTTPAALAARTRRRDVLFPRQLAMYLCHRFTDAGLSEIARAFDREHPAVRNAIGVLERRILERAPVRYQVEALSARIQELEKGEG